MPRCAESDDEARSLPNVFPSLVRSFLAVNIVFDPVRQLAGNLVVQDYHRVKG